MRTCVEGGRAAGRPRGAPASRRGRGPWPGSRRRLEVVQVPAQAAWMRVRSATRSSRWSASSRSSRSGPARRASGSWARAGRRGPRRRHRSGRSCRGCATCAGLRHQLRRHPQAALAALEQEALEAARDVTTVLEGEAALVAEGARPGEQPPMAGRGAGTVSSARSSPWRAPRATAVWLFLCGSIPSTITSVPLRMRPPNVGTAGGHALVGASRPGSYQVTPANLRLAAGDTTHAVNPVGRHTA